MEYPLTRALAFHPKPVYTRDVEGNPVNQEELLAGLASADRFRSVGGVYLKVTTDTEILWMRAITVHRPARTEPPWEENALVIEGLECVARLPRRPYHDPVLVRELAATSMNEPALDIGEISIRRRTPEDRARYFDAHFPALRAKMERKGIPKEELDALFQDLRSSDTPFEAMRAIELAMDMTPPEVMWGVDPGEEIVGVAGPFPILPVPFPHKEIQQAILDISKENWAKFWEESSEQDLKTQASQALVEKIPLEEPQEKMDVRHNARQPTLLPGFEVPADDTPGGIRFLAPHEMNDDEVERFRREFWALQNTTAPPSIIRRGAGEPIVIRDVQTDGPATDENPWFEDGGDHV